MNEVDYREAGHTELREPRKPYLSPKLKRLGTIRELTQALPGATPVDSAPLGQVGSTM